MIEEGRRARERAAVEYPPRIVAGVRPTPAIHLGHYFGAIRHHVDLHHQYPDEGYFFIADYHALTRHPNAEYLQSGIAETVAVYLAAGLDPTKAHLYRQSDVPEVCELAWILSTFVGVGDALRNPTYKDFESSKKHPHVGLLTYPILMAADILAVRGTIVPAGPDQSPMIEMCRHTARKFNRSAKSEYFPQPRKGGFAQVEVPGTDGRKMSTDQGNTIALMDPDKLRAAVKSIQTGSESVGDPKDPKKCVVHQLFALVASEPAAAEMATQYRAGGYSYSQAKDALTIALLDFAEPMRDRSRGYRSDPSFLADILRAGAKSARHEIRRTLSDVRRLVGLTRY